MNYINYLKMSCERLQSILPGDENSLFTWLMDHPGTYNIEVYHGYIFCLFTHPYVSFEGEVFDDPKDFCECPFHRMFLLVFDGDTIIADLSTLTGYTPYFSDAVLIDRFFQTQNDWLLIEQGISASYAQQVYPDTFEPNCITTLINNAYVTESYRRQGIFKIMLNMIHDMLIPQDAPRIDLMTVISLDPDFACYGPDAIDEPHHYSMEDEPKRKLNQEIIEKLDFSPVRINEEILESNEDGAKVWFAVKLEYVHIAESDSPKRS